MLSAKKQIEQVSETFMKTEDFRRRRIAYIMFLLNYVKLIISYYYFIVSYARHCQFVIGIR